MILYLFIKDRVEPCFPYLCNSYNLARMVIPVICNEIIIKKLIFCEHFNALKDLPGPATTAGPENAGNGVTESTISKIFRGTCPGTPLEVRAFGTNVRTYGTHVRLFHQ